MHRRVVLREIRRLRCIRHYVDLLVSTRPRVLRRIQTLLEAYQTAHARYSEVCSRTTALAAAVTQVEQAVAHYEAQWLTRLEQGLESVINKRAVGLDTVVFAPLEAVYSDLLDAALRTTADTANGQGARGLTMMRSALLRTVRQVTRKGLGEMLQTAAEPGAILTAIEEGRFAYASPLWGGNGSAAEPLYRFVVFPPMAAADLAELKQAAEERHFGPTLVMAETVVAGCCIVALGFFPVNKLNDVLTPVYTSGLAGATPQPQAASMGVPLAGGNGHAGSVAHPGTPVVQELEAQG